MQLTLAQIAAATGAELSGDPQRLVGGVAPFETAGEDELTYAAGARFLKRLDASAAGAVLVPAAFEAPGRNLLRVANPELAFVHAVRLFHPVSPPAPGISPAAHIGSGFTCGADCTVGPTVVIGNDVTLGRRVVLHPGVVIGDAVVIGDEVEILPNVTVLGRCRIGNRVTLQPGSVIGSDGFGYVYDHGRYHKLPHLGIVQIDDDVEIGAANTIDRAKFGRTWIQRGVKTDNLVHIAHNVTVGEDTVIAAQVGIAGSTTIGRRVRVAGQAGIGNHLTVGDGVTVGPQAGVARDVGDRAVVSGTPEMPHPVWLRVSRLLPWLPDLKKRLDHIEKRLRQIEGLQDG